VTWSYASHTPFLRYGHDFASGTPQDPVDSLSIKEEQKTASVDGGVTTMIMYGRRRSVEGMPLEVNEFILQTLAVKNGRKGGHLIEPLGTKEHMLRNGIGITPAN
jgi:hypothetical protein